jgi:hypothetical protein
MNVRESQIEDVLAQYPDIAKAILGMADDLSLVARQKILPSGERIDLLLVTGKTIVLLELKVGRYEPHFLAQILGYTGELANLQQTGKLVSGEIIPYLMCTDCTTQQVNDCSRKSVRLVKYSAEEVLEGFFSRMQSTASFMTLKPSNHGLWNIHLLNRILYALDKPKGIPDLQKISSLSKSSVASYLRLAAELLLVRQEASQWALTDEGRKYVWNRAVNMPPEHLSDEQGAVLQEVIVQNPFSSGAISGIYTLVESLYNLSRNTYPVKAIHLADYFRQSAGTFFRWNARKTAMDAMRMYSNYAIDIGLVARMGEMYYLTPSGVRFILLLNLHKTIEMVDALGVSKTQNP